MAINPCQELGKIFKNNPDIKEYLQLKAVNVNKSVSKTDIDNLENTINKLIDNSTNLEVKEYLRGVRDLNKVSFLTNESSQAAHKSVISNTLDNNFKKIISNVKSREDLQKIVNVQNLYIKNLQDTTEILNNFGFEKATVKQYLNKMILMRMGGQNIENITNSFFNFIERNVDKNSYNEIRGMVKKNIDVLNKLDVNNIPFKSGEGIALNYKGTISKKQFNDFIKNKDNYIKNIEIQNVSNKINVVSNYNLIKTRIKELETTIQGLGTNTKIAEELTNRVKELDRILSTNSDIQGLNVLKLASDRQLQDRASRIGLEVSGYNTNLPLNEQRKILEERIKNVTGKDNFQVLLEGNLFKVKGDGWTKILSQKDLDNLSNTLNSIHKLDINSANNIGVKSSTAGLEADLISYPQAGDVQVEDLLHSAIESAKGGVYDDIYHINEDILSGNASYFGKSIVGFVEGFLMNLELIEENNPFFAKILKRQSIISDSSTRGNISKGLQDVNRFLESNSDKLTDNYGGLILSNLVDGNISNKELDLINDAWNKYGSLSVKSEGDVNDLLKSLYDIRRKVVSIKGVTYESIFRDLSSNKLYQEIKKVKNTISKKEDASLGYYLYKNYDKFIETRLSNLGDSLVSLINRKYKPSIIGEYKRGYEDILKEKDNNLTSSVIEDIIEDKVDELFNNNPNFVLINSKLSNYELTDNIFSTLQEYKSGLLNIEVGKMKLGDKKAQSVINGLLGESVYPNNWFGNLIKTFRKWTYNIQLGYWSPKGFLLAGYNVLSGGIKSYSNYSPDIKLYNELQDFYKRMREEDPVFFNNNLKQFTENEIGDNILTNENTKFVDDNSNNWEFMTNLILDNTIKVGDKLKLDTTKLRNANRQEIAAKLSGPMPLADKAAENIFGVNQKLIAESIGEANIGIDELNRLYDEISRVRKIKNQLNKATGNKTKYKRLKKEYDKMLENGEVKRAEQASKQIKKYLTDIKAESTAKYQSFYKATQQLGLSRNTMSDWWYINYFSSWGSKTSAEYVFGTVGKAYKEAMLTAKGVAPFERTSVFFTTFVETLALSPQFNALFKQVGYAARVYHHLNRNEEADIDTEKLLKESTLLYQGILSSALTRAFSDVGYGYKIASEQGDNFAQSSMIGVLNGARSLLSNFLKETKYIIGPGVNGMIESLDKEEPSVGQFLNNSLGLYVDMYSSAYQNVAVNNLGYYMTDRYGGLTQERPDSWIGYNMLESLSGIGITEYGSTMDKMKNYKYISDMLENSTSLVSGLKDSMLGYYYGSSLEDKKGDLVDKLNSDDVFLQLRDDANINNLSNETILKAYELLGKSDLMSGWSLDDDGNGKYKGNLQLVLNQLRDKGEDVDEILELVNSAYKSNSEKDKIKLQKLAISKAGQAVLLSKAAQQEYQTRLRQFMRVNNLTKTTDEQKEAIKIQVMKEYSPKLATLDKDYHANLLDSYIRNEYEGKYKSAFENTNINEYLELRFMTEVADASDIEWTPKLFNTMSARILKDVPDEEKPEKIANYFDTIDKFGFVGNSGKNIMKSGILYTNRNNIKKLLNSDYGDKFKEGANKLANIIWDYSRDIKNTPSMLNDLLGEGGSKRINLSTDYNKPKTNISSKVFKGVQDLANDIIKIPEYKDIPIKSVMKKISLRLNEIPYVELDDIDLPKIEDLQKEIKTLKTKSLKTDDLKIARGEEGESDRIRKPSI